jgi:hypothetical protein
VKKLGRAITVGEGKTKRHDFSQLPLIDLVKIITKLYLEPFLPNDF